MLELLALEAEGDDRFRATSTSEWPGRLYGGQVASQALRAATFTVDQERRPHSFHAYFVRGGRPGVPVVLDVARTRDGRSFSTRTVDATQEGETILSMVASFHAGESGDDWQDSGLPSVPRPDELSPRQRQTGRWRGGDGFEMRPVRAVEGMRIHPCWVRFDGPIGDDPQLHACALAYISDRAIVGSVRAPGSTMQINTASLDHAVWFHRPCRVDEWLLFCVDPVTNYGARGLARGTFHTEEGVLVASLAQEALLRPVSLS